jgi:NADH:ubiquinone oxidoreductase subunit C
MLFQNTRKSRYCIDLLSKQINWICVSKDLTININIFNLHKLCFVVSFLKKHLYFSCKFLVDIFVIDYLTFLGKCSKYTKERFQLNYNLYSLSFNWRIFVNILINDQYTVISLDKIFKNAGWLEREIWDLYGVIAVGNADLRRLLTDYGFKGFPLRKDFPLCGFVELAYDEEIKTLIYQFVELSQDYRQYTFKMVWK